MSIYDFTPEELEEIRIADESMDRRRGPKKDAFGWGGDRRSATAKAKNMNHPGNALWEFRVSRGLTQRELEEQMLVCQQEISKMERGVRPISEYVLRWMEAHKDG